MQYPPFYKVNLFFRTYIQMFGNILKPSSWMPFLYLAVFQLLGILVLTSFSLPGWKSVVKPFLAMFLPREGFHFPYYLLTMPRIFADYDNYILGPTAWVILSAAGVYVLGNLYAGERARFGEGLSRAFRSYFKLLIVWLIELALVFVIMKVVSILFIDLVYGSPRRMIGLNVALQLAAFIPSAFLIYATPAIILDKKSLFKALGDSLSLCGHNIFLTYFIILIPGLLRLVLDILIHDFGARIVFAMNADLIVVLLVVKILAGVFINLFILGGATYIYRVMGK
jgi:hypothetical protein